MRLKPATVRSSVKTFSSHKSAHVGLPVKLHPQPSCRRRDSLSLRPHPGAAKFDEVAFSQSGDALIRVRWVLAQTGGYVWQASDAPPTSGSAGGTNPWNTAKANEGLPPTSASGGGAPLPEPQRPQGKPRTPPSDHILRPAVTSVLARGV